MSKRDPDDGRVRGFADESFNTSEYRALRLLFRDESRGALERLRAGSLAWSAALRDTVVEVVDGLRALADAAEDEIEVAELGRNLGRALAAVTGGEAPDTEPDPGSSAPHLRI